MANKKLQEPLWGKAFISELVAKQYAICIIL